MWMYGTYSEDAIYKQIQQTSVQEYVCCACWWTNNNIQSVAVPFIMSKENAESMKNSKP